MTSSRSTDQEQRRPGGPYGQGLFERAMRHAAIGMALVTADGSFLDVNGALCQLLGRDAESLKLLQLKDVTHPDDLAESFRLVGEMLGGTRDSFQREKRYIHADGHVIWGQVSVACVGEGSDCLFVVQIVDISQIKRQQQALAHQDDQYRLLAENAADVVCRFNPQGRMEWLSPSIEPTLGWMPEQWLGHSLAALTVADDRPRLADLESWIRKCQRGCLDLRLRCADGSQRWMSVSLHPIRSHDGTWLGAISGWRDIQGEIEVRELLDRALHTDQLTGLPNRTSFLEQLDGPGRGALMSVGINRLTEVNHALTHRAGDRLIQTVASRLVVAMGGDQGIARGTGDTFIVHAEAVHTPEQASALADRLRQACKGPIGFDGNTIDPTVSIGVTLWRRGITAEEWLRDAVIAMRQAAAAGRDRCVFADARVGDQARQSLERLEQLRAAIQHDAFQPWFMPLVDMATGALSGYEILVRWLRPDGRIEAPDAFLPLARQGQLAAEIDLLMLQKAIEALRVIPGSLTVAVNLTPSTLGHPSLVERVQEGLRRHGLAPERLHLEITETALLNRGPEIDAAIQQLAAMGVRWVVDDFGTGYSSISNLRDLPIHGLKLDRSFTEGIRKGDQKSLRLAQALAGLGEGLGLITVAEGIESPDEAAALHELGWQLGQGYHYGAPAPLGVAHLQGRRELAPCPPRPSITRSNWALAVTENVPVGLFALRVTPERRIELLFMSRRSLDMLQLDRDRIAADSRPLLSRLHPHDRLAFMRSWSRCSRRQQAFSWQGRLLIHGAISWVRIESVPIAQVDGSLIWQGVISDITAQKQQELHLRQILNEAPIPIVIQELEAESPRITFINRQFVQCFGYGPADIPTTAEWFRRAYPDPQTRQQLIEAWHEAVAQAKASGGVISGREVEVLTADGSVRDAVFSAVVVGQEIVISAVDLTPWRRAEQELSAARSALATAELVASEENYRLLAENVSDVVFRLDDQGRIVWVSPSLTPTLGWQPDDWIGEIGTVFLVHGGNAPHYQANLEALQQGVVPPLVREQIYAKDGSIHWVETHASPCLDAQGDMKGVVASFRLIDSIMAAEEELRLSEERYRLLATTDSLTGVFNRHHLEGLIRAAIDRTDRYGGALSLILCDIDVFKTINDTHGHQRGDAVLVEFSQRIQHQLRRTDAFGRWGGEEFIILLPSTTGACALAVAEELRQRIASNPFAGVGQVTASFGVAQREPGESETAWFRRVDDALYAAKQAGRNIVLGG